MMTTRRDEHRATPTTPAARGWRRTRTTAPSPTTTHLMACIVGLLCFDGSGLRREGARRGLGCEARARATRSERESERGTETAHERLLLLRMMLCASPLAALCRPLVAVCAVRPTGPRKKEKRPKITPCPGSAKSVTQYSSAFLRSGAWTGHGSLLLASARREGASLKAVGGSAA